MSKSAHGKPRRAGRPIRSPLPVWTVVVSAHQAGRWSIPHREVQIFMRCPDAARREAVRQVHYSLGVPRGELYRNAGMRHASAEVAA